MSASSKEVGARFALAKAWVAAMPVEQVTGPPLFRLADDADSLDVMRAAQLLARADVPVALVPEDEPGVLRIRIASLTDDELTDEVEPLYQLPARSSTTERRILVVAAGIRFVMTAAEVESAIRDYRVRAPSAAAGDYADSPFAGALQLSPPELESADEVMVLGRSTAAGWEFSIVPHAQEPPHAP